MNPMEIAAREILASAPAVPKSVLARWSDAGGVVDWDGLADWHSGDGGLPRGAWRIIGACIALARAEFVALDAADADAVADALARAAATYRAEAAVTREAMARLRARMPAE